MNSVRNFWNADQGQDKIECSLLMAFLGLASVAVFLIAVDSTTGIWLTSNANLRLIAHNGAF